MNNIYVGKITGCHGIKGELKVLSDFEYPQKVFQNDFSIIIDNNTYKITSIRKHKNFYLITVNNLKDINLVNYLINKEIYVQYDSLNLKENEYLLEELIGAKVFENDENLGTITDIFLGKNTNFVKVNNSFLIPLIDEYIKYFDKTSKILYTKNSKSLKI